MQNEGSSCGSDNILRSCSKNCWLPERTEFLNARLLVRLQSEFRLKSELFGRQKIYMILQEKLSIELKPPMLKILCASIAHNNSVVVARLDKPCQQQSIVHLDHKGQILWEHPYNSIIDFFAMPNEKEVIVLNVADQMIDVINLQTYQIRQLPHHFLFEDTASMAIYTFPLTSLFCLAEKGDFNDHRLRLTYYPSADLHAGSLPKTEWNSKENEWTSDHNVERINYHSKVGWWTYKDEEEVTFSFFDLEGSPEGKLSVVKVKNSLSNLYEVEIRLAISYLWEIDPCKYMLVAISNKFQHKQRCKTEGEHGLGVFNNNYIVDTKLGNEEATIRETNFVFDVEEDGFMYNDQLIDCFGIGDVSVFHTFRHKKGELQETPVYYVNNQTERIIYKETWQSVCHNANFFFPGWDASTVIQSSHQNGDCKDLVITKRKAIEPREIYLHFLLFLNEDFDDDLLQDAIDLLC